MEESIKFNGSLNLDQSITPSGDYINALNITRSSDDQGGLGAAKRLRSIKEFSDGSDYGVPKATTIDTSGNQYVLSYRASSTVTYFELASTPAGIDEGQLVTQSNGFVGIIVDVNNNEIHVLNLSGTASAAIDLDSTSWASVSVNSITDFSSRKVCLINKIDTSGSITPVVFYEVSTEPTVTPDLKRIGNILVWNYLEDGIPLSYLYTRDFSSGYFTDNYSAYTNSGLTADAELSNIYLIKKPPVDISVTASSSGSNDKQVFADTTFDFACRYIYDSGEVSVLSPYKTILAESDLSELNQGIDGIDNVQLSVTESLPSFVSKVEWYARANKGSWRRVSTEDDGSAVTFIGQMAEALSTDDSTRIFDTVPQSAEALEVIKNRLFLGNVKDDLDVDPLSQIGGIILTGNSATDYTTGGTAGINDPVAYQELGSTYGTIEDDVTGGTYFEKRGALTNDSLYKIGIVWMDEFLRSRGVDPNSVRDFKTGNFDFPTRVKDIQYTGVVAPSWAKWGQVVVTRNLSKDFSIEGYARSIFFELENDEGVTYFANSQFSTRKLNAVVIDADISYTFQQGDKANLRASDGTVTQLKVKSVIDGLIYLYPNSEIESSVIDLDFKYFEIFSPKDTSVDDSNIFFGTKHVIKASTIEGVLPALQYTLNDPEIYDQTFIKEEVDQPIINKYIDSEEKMVFESLGVIDQPSLPIKTKDSLIWRSTDTAETVTSSLNRVYFNAISTNDYLDTPVFNYVAYESSHSVKVGDVQEATAATGIYEYVVKIINENVYITAIQAAKLFVADASGFADGDKVTITMDERDSINCVVVNVNTTGDNYIDVANMTNRELADIMDGSAISVSNGATSEEITSTDSYSTVGTSLDTAKYGTYNTNLPLDYTNRTIFSNKKAYACDSSVIAGFNANYNYFSYPIQSNRFPSSVTGQSDPQLQLGDFGSIMIPHGNGASTVKYSITTEVPNTNTDTVDVEISYYKAGVLTSTTIYTMSSGVDETQTASGTIEIERDPDGSIDVLLSLSKDPLASDQDATIKKGSYIEVVVDESEETNSSLNTSTNKSYTLSRKPNKRLEDDFSWDRYSGKPSVEDSGVSAVTFDNKIRWGGKYIEGAITNPISSFNSSSQASVPEESGSITSLVRASMMSDVGSVLLALCTDQTNSIYIGERIVTNNDGTQQLLASDSVVGSVQPLLGNRGCQHKNSISKDNTGTVVWWDNDKKDICRYTREGIVAISDINVKSFFQDESGNCVSFYDKLIDTFFFHFPSSSKTYKTISFNQGTGWVSKHNFGFLLGGEKFDDRSFPIGTDNKVYKTIGNDYGNYFGTDNTLSDGNFFIHLSKYFPSNVEPIYVRLRGDLIDFGTYTVEPIDLTITNNNNQSTTLDENFFEIEGSYIFSDVYRDENSSGGKIDGITLCGSNVDIKLELNEDDASSNQKLDEFYIGFRASRY